MLRTQLYRMLALLLFFGLCQDSANPCYAHPFHTSLTEMDWNPQTSRWEIGMRVYASDLEVAIQKLFPEFRLDGQPMEDPACGQHIQTYIEQNFYSQDFRYVEGTKESSVERSPELSERNLRNGPRERKVSSLQWVGSELEGSWLWLYFECDFPPSDPVRIVHRMLFDVNSDQMNVISIRKGSKRFSTQTHAQLEQFVFRSDTDEMPQER